MTKRELLDILADMPDNAVISISGEYKYYNLTSVYTRKSDELFTPDLYPDKEVSAHIFFKIDEERSEDEDYCNTDCPRYCAGTCPYPHNEKSDCPRVRQIKEVLKGLEDIKRGDYYEIDPETL